MWVDDVVLLKTRDATSAPDVAAWNREVFRQRIFDNLIANIDRNQGNLLLDPIWNLILIDHSRAFTAVPTMPFPMTRIDRDLYGKLKALDEPTLKARLGKLLYDGKDLYQRVNQLEDETAACPHSGKPLDPNEAAHAAGARLGELLATPSIN